MINKTKSVLGAALLLAGLAGGMTAAIPQAQARVDIFVPLAPPERRVEVVPPPYRHHPERYVWRAGYWRWDGRAYAWVPGHYVRIPRHYRQWEEGRWEHRPGGWIWIGGHWR